jgi:hypothetical protein
MQYAYAYQLNGTQTAGLDPDAKAYIDSVVAAGATVTSTQRNAINNFYKTGKAQGWYSQLKRIYLPIWANVNPNAIDMVSLATGSFVGGVTHASGYVQGNGTTGYFNFGVSPSSLGLTILGGTSFALVNQQDSRTDTRYFLGVTDVVNRRVYLRQEGGTTISTTMYQAASIITNPTSARSGIFLAAVNSATSRYLKRRAQSGVVYTTENINSESTGTSQFNQFAMAANIQNSTISGYTDARLGAFGLGLGMSSATGDSFTLAVKNLWETCTGLTIP